jgi:hypothetical protein
VDCLKKLRATKGSRNALKKVGYDNVKHLKVDTFLQFLMVMLFLNCLQFVARRQVPRLGSW